MNEHVNPKPSQKSTSPSTLEFANIDKTGDTKTVYDIENPAEVAAAKALFDSLTKEGHKAFHVNAKGEQSTRMDTFDPKAGTMIMVPQRKGG